MLCGKLACPVLAKARAIAKHGELIGSEEVEGSTPPGVFVGRIGYPHVYVGPMVPPYYGDTEILDTPESWVGKPITEIIDYRFSLIRGKTRANIFDAQASSKILDDLQELAMAARPADSEVTFKRKPRKVLALSEETQPFGPSAPLKSFRMSNVTVDRRIEKCYYDCDLKASDAVTGLYESGVLVTRIQRAFSIGVFGFSARRKLVPTRWSITAVDSTISDKLVDDIRDYPPINEFRVYTFRNLDNVFVAILMPANWSFEWIEAWFPGTAWNEMGSRPALMGDWEGYGGRTTYASVGGCYYSCRLAVAEKLSRERRQASALVLREIHPGYILPVGVWNVREGVRAALATVPTRFDNFFAALNHAMRRLDISKQTWTESSVILKDSLFQRRMTDYFKPQVASSLTT